MVNCGIEGGSPGVGARGWAQALTYCVILGALLNPSVPEVSHLEDGHDQSQKEKFKDLLLKLHIEIALVQILTPLLTSYWSLSLSFPFVKWGLR